MTEHIVFIPGVGGREWLFEHQSRNLADVASSEVLVLDTQATRAEMADHVLNVAPQRFSIAGHSLGGWVAQEVAAQTPERVSKLFLSDSWARKPAGTDEYLINYGTPAERDLEGDYSTEHLLPRITADTLVIHGRQNRIVEEDEVRFRPTASPAPGWR